MTVFRTSQAAAEAVRRITDRVPSVACILGSGLGAWADTLSDPVALPYEDLPGFPASTVPGHAGRLIIGDRAGMTIVAMQGRVHGYEGHSPAEVVFPLRTMWQLGARTLIVTNAAGGANPEFAAGDLMLIRDHLNLTGGSPLVGANDDRLGPRFPDMTDAYDPELAAIAIGAATALGFTLREGIYAGMLGPAYETPAEVRMVQRLGGDAVGMSTVFEVIAARHLGMKVLGVSCITNPAAGLGGVLDHADVTDVAARTRDRFVSLLDRVVDRLAAS